MAVQAVTLNGGTHYVSNATRTTRRIGTPMQGANGARRFAHRAVKHDFEVTIEGATEAQRAAFETIANLAGTWTYIDQHGASYTVFCEEDALSDDVTDIATVSGAQVLYYSLTLRFLES
jgi:hypothetical protein